MSVIANKCDHSNVIPRNILNLQNRESLSTAPISTFRTSTDDLERWPKEIIRSVSASRGREVTHCLQLKEYISA